ncbi:uncharacterized protein LOC104893540 [Beta vulgaris subsp. vulgaris]|uniref:uncharacterized protein LOC104893540 n=1 Tax=Beta vulgaris subsp. vulgaris TaxID=3555 RepID=UPI00053F60E5|nr:uncharacterized protein LOC104893540 [Beta vulgaris subsp. vulgaris]
MTISFDEEDGDEEVDRHDGLVVSLTISNCLMMRVLIEIGSLANIMLKNALESMGLQEVDIIKKANALYGFRGEPTRTLGEITLPTYAKGVNLQTRFSVVDCPSTYNIIMGTPWIHKMEVVPSTYHQTIKFPIKWGVHQEIKGDRKLA